MGRVLHMDHQQNACTALTWAPEGKRSSSRLRQTWRKTVEGERQMMGFDTWNKAVVAVRDRSDQRRLVNGPILLEERERTNDDDD